MYGVFTLKKYFFSLDLEFLICFLARMFRSRDPKYFRVEIE